MVDTPSALRFAISATFTAEPLSPVLTFWSGRLSKPFELRFAPFNQVFQTLLDPARDFARNTVGVNIVLFRLEDLGDPLQLESNLRHLAAVARQTHFSVPLILCLCPPSAESVGDPQSARSLMRAELVGSRGVHYLDYLDIGAWYPVDDWRQETGERLGAIPYNDLYFCALGSALVRWTHALYRTPSKVIVLDCDFTLWKGICGEDGPENIEIDESRHRLQEFMVAQREAGMLLAIASKNNEGDVVETFRRNPHMPLRWQDFVATRIDWESKANSIEALSEDLNLALESFVFVDDNPKECAEVSGALPEVLTLPLPADDSQIAPFLSRIWAFDHPVITQEDRRRSELYAKELAFHHERRKTASLEEFLTTLGLDVRITPALNGDMARVAQLTQRTNQFNFTTIRRQESELEALIRSGYECMVLHVADRFGEYGLTGVLLFRTVESAIEVDTFLLSCRVLGRGVEHQVLSWLGNEAARRGIREVVLRLDFTPKNEPARQFLAQALSDCLKESEHGFVCRVPSEVLSRIRMPASQALFVERKSAAPRKEVLDRPDFVEIARKLGTAEQVMEDMRAQATASHQIARQEEMSDVERGLAVIWAELLRTKEIGRESNFFDLGGHSLLAVLLLLRVKEQFGVELSIDDVYAGSLTLADLALRIEQLQLGQMDPEEYAALLAEIENMPDEQVRELLAREGRQEL
jgi:FkbH-like protein